MPPVLWQITAGHLLTSVASGVISAGLYRGRQADRRLEGTEDLIPVSPTEPHEETADGCPGGWYRTRYVDSVATYTRRRVEGGGRVDNPRFSSQETPWQVQQAVMYLEHEQERREAWRGELSYKRSKAAAEARAARRKQGRPRGHR